MRPLLLFVIIETLVACTVIYIRSNDGVETDQSKKGIITEKLKEDKP